MNHFWTGVAITAGTLFIWMAFGRQILDLLFWALVKLTLAAIWLVTLPLQIIVWLLWKA